VKRALTLRNPRSVVQTLRMGEEDNEFLVEMIAAQTLRADSSGALLAKKPEIDLLLRIAGTTQISRAIRERGAKEGEPFLAVAAGRTPLKTPRGLAGFELPRRDLNDSDRSKIEEAALLDVHRA
jgi:tRNA threonylcarbamoyladenosine modification (KEOPS) complex Cgi121 subunit